jgi:16S rRNA (cytosine1402-N4)-methyltransferase
MSHTPVLLDQVIKYLEPQNGGIYVDCTFGNGGYSQKILESAPEARVIAIDQDPQVLETAAKFSEKFGKRFSFIQDNFGNLNNILEPFGLADGIVWDLGVSSMQLDTAERGFSFMKDAYLDMRMSQEGIAAADFINQASQEEIADVIFYNGGENQARKIARKIVEAREISPINTTKQLATIVKEVVKTRNFSIDPSTKTFQAIRIFINNELEVFEKSLAQADKLLKTGGRIVCVSFHSLEDKIIKDYLKANSAKKVAVSKYHTPEKPDGIYKLLTNKPIIPSYEETKINPRSRSAKLRAAIKIS